MSRLSRTSIGRHISTIFEKVARILFTKDMATFLVFLCLSLTLWFMRNVGTSRSMEYELPLTYVGIPNDISVDTELPSHLTIVIRDEGQNLLTHYLWHDMDTIFVDMSECLANASPAHLDFRRVRNQIVANLPQTAQLIDIKPQFMTVEYNRLQHRVLPVRLLGEPNLQTQCVLRDAVTLQPSQVDVYAPKEALDTLECVTITLPATKPLSKPSQVTCAIPKIQGVRVGIDKVQVTIPVEMSTEKQLTVNVQARNFPTNTKLRSFPASVQVTCVVGISCYNAITADDFDVFVDYADVQTRNSDKVELHIEYDKKRIHSAHISPTEVEYLLEK